jgi:hypothetical protein
LLTIYYYNNNQKKIKMELNELNELEAKREELVKILLAEDGFFTQIPKEQLDAFKQAITITARIEAINVLYENKSNMICDVVNGFTAKITPVFVGGEEPMHPMTGEPMPPMMEGPMPPMMEEPMPPMMEDFKCPNCDSGQCVCDQGDQKESTGDMPM